MKEVVLEVGGEKAKEEGLGLGVGGGGVRATGFVLYVYWCTYIYMLA